MNEYHEIFLYCLSSVGVISLWRFIGKFAYGVRKSLFLAAVLAELEDRGFLVEKIELVDQQVLLVKVEGHDICAARLRMELPKIEVDKLVNTMIVLYKLKPTGAKI